MNTQQKKKRVFLIVLDSLGAGALPDADEFGDAGASTLGSVHKTGKLHIPNLISLGLGNVEGLSFLGSATAPKAAFGKMKELSNGKDTTIGHWEISGLVSGMPLPVYPEGFPEDIISAFEKATGRKVICNKPYSGTEVIKDYGKEHIESGALIVYTSADSVFQIAAHESIVPPEKLYEYCKIARGLLRGEHAVGRVIARPFNGDMGSFKRTPNRRDFSLEPWGETILDVLLREGKDVISVGKISDIFAGRGITEAYPSHGNTEGLEITHKMLEKDFSGLCFVNLVDFDMVYGHRNDAEGYALALNEFDAFLPNFMSKMKDDDLLIITADHGCDPGDISTDHTREYVPLLIYGNGAKAVDLGTREGFCDVAKIVAGALGVDFSCCSEEDEICSVFWDSFLHNLF